MLVLKNIFCLSGPVVVSHTSTTEFYIFIRNKMCYKGSQVRGFAIYGVCFKQFYARLDPKSVLTFVAQSVSHCVRMPRWAMDQKKSRVIAQRNRKQLIFLMKHFSTIQGTGAGGQKKQQTSTEFYFMRSMLLKSTGMFQVVGQTGCPLNTHYL